MRVQQSSAFMLDLVRGVADGKMAPAAFQRPYVWKASDVEALFASILEGWPLGSFMIWEPNSDVDPSIISRGRLGPIETPPVVEHSSIILDGQNRLATFAWAIAQATESSVPPNIVYSEAERETWLSGFVLVADHDERAIRFVPAGEANTNSRVPAGVLCGDNRLMMKVMRKAASEGMSDAALDWFDDVAHHIMSSRVTVTTLEWASVEEARRAFLHICRAGVPMSEVDFEAAISWNGSEVPPCGRG